MRVACFTPLAPSPTGVAGYSEALLPALMKRFDVEVFVEDLRSVRAHRGRPVFSHLKFAQRDQRQPFDVCLYHLGNNRLHLFAYRAALDRPGVVVIHDALLQHLLLGISWDAWAEEFACTYGERGREIAATLRGGNPGLHEGFFRYPLVKRVAERSRVLIVHNQAAAERIHREAPGAVVRLIPMLFAERDREVGRAEARRRLGLSPDAFLLGCFGFIREPRRLAVALRVFEALKRDHLLRAEFVLVGRFPSLEMERFLEPRLAAPGIHRPGFVSAPAFDEYAVACDAVINLRHPSAGESSAVAVRLMGLGVPVALSDIPENAAFPADACLRVPADEMEEPLLLEYLLALARDPELGAAIGANARRYIRREHDLERCAALYAEVLAAAQS